MSDPAIEAANRVELGASVEHHRVAAVMGAREALKRIREVYEYFDEYSRGPGDYRAGVRTVLDRLAPLIYSSEELELDRSP